MQIQGVQMPQVKPLQENVKEMQGQAIRFQLIEQIEETVLKDKLESLLSRITEQGNKLTKHMDITDVKLYRNFISEFFYEVTANTHRYARENYLDQRGRHKVYGIIRKVNVQIEELAAELLNQEKDTVKIMDKIGEIQGLLLDIIT